MRKYTKSIGSKVPEEFYTGFKQKAINAGLTVSEYLRGLIKDDIKK